MKRTWNVKQCRHEKCENFQWTAFNGILCKISVILQSNWYLTCYYAEKCCYVWEQKLIIISIECWKASINALVIKHPKFKTPVTNILTL